MNVEAPVSYYAPGEITSPRFAFHFAHGCHGQMTPDDQLFDGPVAMFGSPSKWPILRQARAEGRDWFYGDHGYFRRGEYFRITKNAYQHDGSGTYRPDRFRMLHRRPLMPTWRRDGSHVLVCPNSDIYMGLHGINGAEWLKSVLKTLSEHTDRPIRVRWKHTSPQIRYDVAGAWAVVVFSSASALDALIGGVPVFVLAPFAAGYRMGLSDLTQIEKPIYPADREQFLWNLAHQQWTYAEIMRGQAWTALLEQEDRRRVQTDAAATEAVA